MECYYIYIKKDIAIQITLTDVNYKIMHVYYETKHFVPRQRYDRFSQDNEIIFLCEKKNHSKLDQLRSFFSKLRQNCATRNAEKLMRLFFL